MQKFRNLHKSRNTRLTFHPLSAPPTSLDGQNSSNRQTPVGVHRASRRADPSHPRRVLRRAQGPRARQRGSALASGSTPTSSPSCKKSRQRPSKLRHTTLIWLKGVPGRHPDRAGLQQNSSRTLMSTPLPLPRPQKVPRLLGQRWGRPHLARESTSTSNAKQPQAYRV